MVLGSVLVGTSTTGVVWVCYDTIIFADYGQVPHVPAVLVHHSPLVFFSS